MPARAETFETIRERLWTTLTSLTGQCSNAQTLEDNVVLFHQSAVNAIDDARRLAGMYRNKAMKYAIDDKARGVKLAADAFKEWVHTKEQHDPVDHILGRIKISEHLHNTLRSATDYFKDLPRPSSGSRGLLAPSHNSATVSAAVERDRD